MLQFNSAELRVQVALTKLKHPEMAPLLAFIKKLAEETDAALRRAKPEDFQKLQGRALFIEEFLTAVEQSTEVVERMR